MPGFYDSFVGGQRNALARQASEQSIAQNALSSQQEQQGIDAKQTLAETQWALQSPDPVAAVKSLPHIAAAWQQHGVNLDTLDPDHAKALLQEGQRRAASQLGIGPPQETFGAAQAVQVPGQNGQPPTNAFAQFGSGGTSRIVNGVMPVQPREAMPTSAQEFQLAQKDPAYAKWLRDQKAARQANSDRPPSGYKLNPDGTMAFIPGGPADPNKPQPTSFSGREAQMFQRVVSSANEAAQTIKNITELPEGASTGWFGVGGSPGTGIFSSVKGVLTNKLASQEVQDFNTMLPGLGRSLATIGTAGLAPPGSLTEGFDKLQLREGDTGYTKLRKLAEYRQIVEKGLETNLDNPRIPKEQKETVQRIIDLTREAVPFTHSDITQLQRRQAQNPDFTLQDLMAEQNLKKPAAPAAGWTVTKVP